MSTAQTVDRDTIDALYQSSSRFLLESRNEQGHWEGKLSSSALSTATSIIAYSVYLQKRSDNSSSVNSPSNNRSPSLDEQIRLGINYLTKTQNPDGGWGDTDRSKSNISTTMLARAAFEISKSVDIHSSIVESADRYIKQAGGVQEVKRRYGKDRTFSVPILTACALAEMVEWKEVIPLPFELSVLPHRWFQIVQLPVVSYALPALIAIGRVGYQKRPPKNPVSRILRKISANKSLKVLQSIQPESGGFLEAAPLTGFVAMSLAGSDLHDHPVTQKCLDFLTESMREDGSWPIDTNLATWLTTLSVNALGDELPEDAVEPILEWLLNQQYRTVHPYTMAAPGGWAWTDLSGGVPDADDSPGALLALDSLARKCDPNDHSIHTRINRAVELGVGWLLNLQNRDGGWPTFCRGWGNLPFDRSSPDISAHTIRALYTWKDRVEQPLQKRIESAIERGFRFLAKKQQDDGSWLPLWFGNQQEEDDVNPTYGTSRVLLAYESSGRTDCSQADKGYQWLLRAQREDGGWGGGIGVSSSSLEETALALDALAGMQNRNDELNQQIERGVTRLNQLIEEHGFSNADPIGFYFAKLWYYEQLYPAIFVTKALNRLKDRFE